LGKEDAVLFDNSAAANELTNLGPVDSLRTWRREWIGLQGRYPRVISQWVIRLRNGCPPRRDLGRLQRLGETSFLVSEQGEV
jgi:hypothetical protein